MAEVKKGYVITVNNHCWRQNTMKDNEELIIGVVFNKEDADRCIKELIENSTYIYDDGLDFDRNIYKSDDELQIRFIDDDGNNIVFGYKLKQIVII